MKIIIAMIIKNNKKRIKIINKNKEKIQRKL